MSIIHDALQKSQQQQSLTDNVATPEPIPTEVHVSSSAIGWFDVVLVVIIAALFLMIVYAYYARLIRHGAPLLQMPIATSVAPVRVPIAAPVQVTPSQPAPVVARAAPVVVKPMPIAAPVAPPPEPALPQAPITHSGLPLATTMTPPPGPMPAVAPAVVPGSAPTDEPPLADGTTGTEKLVLNGVLLSDQEKIALINNQPYHLGDTLNGMKIISIELDTVTLQDNAHKITLRT